jgi:signal transduction histidine kinase
MPMRMSTKFSAAIAGVILLAICSSAAALISVWQIGNDLQATLHDHDAIVDAEEMEVSLLGQEGLVASYMLSNGSKKWLDQLDQWRDMFEENLSSMRKGVRSPDEIGMLDEIEADYRQLDKERKEVISLYKEGERDEANNARLEILSARFYEKIYNRCENLIDTIEKRVDAMGIESQKHVAAVAWTVGLCVCVTVILGAFLALLFFRDVVFPLRRMVADAQAYAGDNPINPEDGKNLPIDELRTIGGYLRAMMSDMADTRVTLEQNRRQLLNAEKLASVGKLAASVAHEIRNPLTAVKMWLYSMRKAVGDNPELLRKLDIVSDEIARLENILRNFLAFSRPPALKPRPELVVPLIDKTLELFGPRIEGKNIRLLRKETDGLPAIVADPDQLRQVWVNLLNNAADAVGDSGEICVQTDAQRESDGRRMVVVRFQNTGPAMPEDVKQRIFEPFYTTKESGTGLGLCIAASIMAQHGGRLVLESSTAERTTFAVWIPAADGSAKQDAPS